MAGFTINATDALRLMAQLAAQKAVLVTEVRKATSESGKAIQTTARGLARSRSMPSLSGSIATKTKQTVSGTEVTVEAKSPFGVIREYVIPRPFMLPALMAELPNWEAKLSAAAGRALR